MLGYNDFVNEVHAQAEDIDRTIRQLDQEIKDLKRSLHHKQRTLTMRVIEFAPLRQLLDAYECDHDFDEPILESEEE